MADMSKWWACPISDLANFYNTNIKIGLSETQVPKNAERFGKNTFAELKPSSTFSLLIEGIKSPMMLLLLSIAVLSLIFSKFLEAAVMVFVVLAYVFIELINKARTDRTLKQLKALAQPTLTVIRAGNKSEIASSELVVGDLIVLSSGVRVPADGRIIESKGLVVDESTLTGESNSVRKDAESEVPEEAPLTERTNSVFSGTVVLDGEGIVLVTAVGEKSEFGKIAKEVQITKKENTYLQITMINLAKMLAVVAFAVSLIVPGIGVLRGQDFQQMVITWLALTFLMVPGQPPIIITMALALASFELAKENIITKRLRGTETLGFVTVVVTDKTGTVTENKIRLEKLISADGNELEKSSEQSVVKEKVLLSLPEHSRDPTDEAVFEALGGTQGKKIHPDIFIGFARGQPWRILVYKKDNSFLHAIAGKPEILINSSNLPQKEKEKLLEILEKETAAGERVVAYAVRFLDKLETDRLTDLDFVALAILTDPVREGVKEAITSLELAGVTTVIVTGDHPGTAKAVAEKIGLSGEVVTGDQIERLKDDELRAVVKKTRVFARVAPLQKLQLIKAFQADGEKVAMIGDGINDAAAIKSADVGIAMGKMGTDLAKESADLVLTDDNYVHIPEAITNGRKSLDNFQKGLTYYLTAKAILLSIFLIPLILGIPFPLNPIHIIIIELLMDLASSTIFVTEQKEPNLLQRMPENVQEYLKSTILEKIFVNGIGLALGITVLYVFLYFQTDDLVLAQTAAFSTWLLGHICLALNMKQRKLPLLKQGIFSNRFASLWLAGMIVLTVTMTNIPVVFPYLKTTFLPFSVWGIILIMVIVTTFWIEVKKMIRMEARRETDEIIR
ncbi:cation-translocating P-type ATPase [Methanosarcina sp. UBA5]|uniref:cation-translocating P-type ATPase n=1 Tax=Methanosarcina sp. UBA5 TaxID=1915593 RepID=UPI0025E2E1CB|nr:cation-transporting P-type ATPase [Methanosarcina sp. UBA5]